MLDEPAQIFMKGLMVIQVGQRVNFGEPIHNDILDTQILLRLHGVLQRPHEVFSPANDPKSG
ncbi:hypothetical protein D3C80_2201920 [compost metagenome]